MSPVPPFSYASAPVAPGRTLIEASAGTGKTFAIAGLVLRLVLDGDTLAPAPGALPDLRRLLVVTFTRAATEELRGRIRAALRAALRATEGAPVPDDARPLLDPLAPLLARPGARARLDEALGAVDEAAIETIHGFCKRVLTQAAFESGMPFDLSFLEQGEDDGLQARAVADVWTTLLHDDVALAEIALGEDWSTALLQEHYRRATRFPDTAIWPAPAPLDDARAALDEAVRALAAAWDPDDLAARLGALTWNKDAPLKMPGGQAVLDDVARFLGGRWQHLAAVRQCAPEGVAEKASKQSKAAKAALEDMQAHPSVQACAALLDAVEALRVSVVASFAERLGARFDALKRRRAVVTSDDLLHRLREALARPDAGPALAAEIRRRFAVALVDEFQDTDPVQYAIFRTAFEGAPLVFVGDPKQAIYAFRGADIHAYLGAQGEADRRFTLGTNWRSARLLVEAVNAVFAQPARPFLADGIPFRPVEPSPARHDARLAGDGRPPLVWWSIPGPEGGKARTCNKETARAAVRQAVVGEIVRLLSGAMTLGADGQPLHAGDIAVLVSKNEQAREMQDALRQAGVPAIVTQALDIRRSAEMQDVEYLLNAFAQPEDNRALRAALATELWGRSAADIAALDDDDDALAAVRAVAREGARLWRRHGVLRALVAFIDAEGVPTRLLRAPDGERRLTNLRHVAELLHEAERGGERLPDDLLAWLRDRENQRLGGRDKAEQRLESDARAVQISTLHNSKGLEYEVVFLPSLWDWNERKHTPDFRATQAPLARIDGRMVYDIGSPDQESVWTRWETDRLAEGLRLAYVAMTRARERLYVAWGAAAGAGAAPLGYLLAGHTAPLDDDLDAHVAAARGRGGSAAEAPLQTLRALAERYPEQMTVEPLPDAPPGRLALAAPDGPAHRLAARTVTPEARASVLAPWRAVSFSAWAATQPGAAPRAGADEPDHRARADAPATGIHAFAAGRVAGTCLHEILQGAAFAHPPGADDPPADSDAADPARDAAARILGAHGLADPRRHRAPIDPLDEVMALVERVATAPLPGAGFCLADTAPAARAAEWRFVAPVARLAPADLAAVFRAHAVPEHRDAYADALADLSPDAADGFLTGIADLVVCHDDRWAVIDWKSNHLGPTAEAYTPEALDEAMAAHHYVLQATLYLVGLHRTLAARLPGYDYDRHVAGAFYVFLRGLRPGASDGIVAFRPPRALVEALDALLSTGT